MGYYIGVPKNKGKAEQLAKLYGAQILPAQPHSFADVSDGKAVICVVDNGPFEAAGLCYSEREFESFAAPDMAGPQRPRIWVLMDKTLAHELAGYGG